MEETHKNASEDTSVEQNLASDYVPKSKLGGLPLSNQIDDAIKEKQAKAQKDIEKFKEEIKKKYKFIESVGIIPAQANKKVEEEYEISKEDAEKGLIHLLVVIPEKHFKKIGEVRLEAINLAKKINPKLWAHIMTPVDIWNLGLDSKFEVMEALSMSFPLYDKGLLGALRSTQIHKSLVLKKFEKYVTSYVVAGSLTRGEATKTSDVDVFIIIDDTDVKQMPRLELKEKLRSIIHSYIQEAQAIAGVKNILNIQTYLLTEFWDSVKDAHPVMFTFIRDGYPLYDRGAFLPWKSLLKMGKIKPSPEAIDMFMSSGNKLKDNIDRRLLDIAVMDIYWGVLTPSQGILMLYGLSPSTPKETVKLIREVFLDKEKILEEKYVKIIEDIVSFYKGYEHGKNKKISGNDLDKMIKDSLDYMTRLKELREQIEKRVQEKSINATYKDVFEMIGSLLKKKSEDAILKGFKEELIDEGKFPPRFLENLKFIVKIKNDLGKSEKLARETTKAKATGAKATVKAKAKAKDGMTSKQSFAVDKARKYSVEIINALMEYSQRCDFLSMDRTRFIIKGKDSNAEVFFLSSMFLVQGSKIQKIAGDKLVKSDPEELKERLMAHKEKETKVNSKSLEILKKIFGEFELVY